MASIKNKQCASRKQEHKRIHHHCFNQKETKDRTTHLDKRTGTQRDVRRPRRVETAAAFDINSRERRSAVLRPQVARWPLMRACSERPHHHHHQKIYFVFHFPNIPTYFFKNMSFILNTCVPTGKGPTVLQCLSICGGQRCTRDPKTRKQQSKDTFSSPSSCSFSRQESATVTAPSSCL